MNIIDLLKEEFGWEEYEDDCEEGGIRLRRRGRGRR